MKIEYRKASIEDAGILVDIYDDAFIDDYIRYGECPGYGNSLEQMVKSIKVNSKYIAICENIPVGVISYDNKGDGVYYIGCLAVKKQYQGKRIGSGLINYLQKMCPDWRRLELITPADKVENINFYTKRNCFVIDGKKISGNVELAKLSMELEFHKVTEYSRGTLHEQLLEGYSCDERYSQCFNEDWIEYDRFFYDNPKIADNYACVTVLNGKAIGHISWDPRHRPEYVEIGHNCILPKYKGHGFGRRQLYEAVSRIREYENLTKIIVGTNSNLVAPHNYESVGFVLTDRTKNTDSSSFSGDYLKYEMLL